jgi:hypothetical protein
MRIELPVPASWKQDGDRRWLVEPGVVVTTSRLEPEVPVVTPRSLVAFVRAHLPGARVDIDRSAPLATRLGWPAVAFEGRLFAGGELVGHRFGVFYEILDHRALAVADAPQPEVLARARQVLEEVFGGARPVWASGPVGLCDLFEGIAHL